MTLDNDSLKWVGVDFDKTLCNSTDYPEFKILEPLPGAVEAMQKLNSEGWKIIIITARGWADYQKIEEWCEEYKLPIRRIICGKPLVKYMIDDRNIEFSGDWDGVLAKIKR